MMNLSTDLDRRWSPALSQWPKPVMAQRDPTSMAEDQSVDVNRLESQAETWSLAATVGPAQHLNRLLHQVQQAADQLQNGLQASINHWQQAVALQVAHIPAIELSLTS